MIAEKVLIIGFIRHRTRRSSTMRKVPAQDFSQCTSSNCPATDKTYEHFNSGNSDEIAVERMLCPFQKTRERIRKEKRGKTSFSVETKLIPVSQNMVAAIKDQSKELIRG